MRDFLVMLRRQDYGVQRHRAETFVAYRHLRLHVRAQPAKLSRLPDLCLPFRQAVSELDRQGHHCIGLAACKPEHETLIPCTLVQIQSSSLVNALANVRRLLGEGYNDRATPTVKADGIVIVSNIDNRIAGNLAVVDPRIAGDLASQNDQPCLHQRFTSNARLWVGAENRIEDGIRNVIGQLIRMARADGFGREYELPSHGMPRLGCWSWKGI